MDVVLLLLLLVTTANPFRNTIVHSFSRDNIFSNALNVFGADRILLY
jgi:hypothetical protein